MTEELRLGADVVAADGRKVGKLKYIVIDSIDGTVSELIVEPGLLQSGQLLHPSRWDEPTAVVVPAELVQSADEHAVHLHCPVADFKNLPPYTEQEYVRPDESWTPPPGYTVADFLLRLAAPFGGIIPPPVKLQLRKGPLEREIKPGTPVWRREPHTEIGRVERVLVDPVARRIICLIIHRGGIVPFHVKLPLGYISEILDDVIYIDLTDEQIEALLPFNPDDVS